MIMKDSEFYKWLTDNSYEVLATNGIYNVYRHNLYGDKYFVCTLEEAYGRWESLNN